MGRELKQATPLPTVVPLPTIPAAGALPPAVTVPLGNTADPFMSAISRMVSFLQTDAANLQVLTILHEPASRDLAEGSIWLWESREQTRCFVLCILFVLPSTTVSDKVFVTGQHQWSSSGSE